MIVVEQRTGVECAGWGGILSNAARLKGVSGVIVEGLARDIDEAREIGFPVYARGGTARTARGRIHEANTGEPIHVDDVLGLDLADAGHRLFVVHALARGLVDLAEADLVLALDGIVDLDADGDEAQPQIALPVGSSLLGHCTPRTVDE